MTEVQRHLGRYELFRRIAKGGMGEIYLARTRGVAGFEKTLIIKTILPHLAEEEEFVTKFLDEGHIVTRLSHGNIVSVFDMGEEDGEYFMAMEYVPGNDLRAILKVLARQGRTMPVELAIHIAAEVCKGLGYAHRKLDENGQALEIVHRDVSPSNVLVSREGEVKIIDFGIARAAGRLSKTISGRIQGKFCYMSPEQAAGKNVDGRSDLFSTAVVLYEMLTGIRPFEGDSDLETLDRVRACTFDPPSVFNAEVDEELDAIICKALARDPQARYDTIDELHVELVQYLFGLGQTVTGQQVSHFLCELFPEPGLPGGIDDSSAEEGLDLEAALNLEFARLGLDDSLAKAALTRTHTEARPVALAVAPQAAGDGEKDAQPLSLTPTTMPESAPALAPAPSRPGLARNAIVLTVALTALLLLGLFALQQMGTSTGTVFIDSEPSGARVLVNGAQLIGVTTPHEVDLPGGEHSIQLSLEAHHPRTFRVLVEPGRRFTLTASEARLEPVASPAAPTPRAFQIVSDPDAVLLHGNGLELGLTPRKVEVPAGEVLNLTATRHGCSPTRYSLTYGHASDTVRLELTCEDSDTDSASLATQRPVTARQGSAQNSAVSSPERNGRTIATRRVSIESTPSGARLSIDGQVMGETPLGHAFPTTGSAEIEVHLEGYRKVRRTLSLASLDNTPLHFSLEQDGQGCLDFRAINPAYNEIAINGRWLPGRYMKLEKHPLPPGSHRLTVRNAEADREETFHVQIEAGERCTHLVVWER
jgi:eukaryotic-like serine/threonine-protein kinase